MDELNIVSGGTLDVDKLTEQLSSLTPNQRKLLKGKLLGFTQGLPPTIDEFLDSNFFMGKTWGGNYLYPYWRQVLRDLYPDEITTSHNIVVESLALGTGKTTVSVVMAAYNLCRLMFLKDLSRSGMHDTSKPIVFLFNHTSADKARQECVDPMWDAMNKSLFFSQKKYPFPKKFEIVADSLRSNKAVGTNLLFASFSEVNFLNAEKMRFRMNTIINRYTNRFMNFMGSLGNIILDSSPSGTDSLVESFLRKTPFEVKILRATVWEVKGFLGGYSSEMFTVYAGDPAHSPFILEGDNVLPDAHDPDRVIQVPMNLYNNYKNDIRVALQDTAGLSISSTGTFIRNKTKIHDCFHLQVNYPDKVTVDLFNPEDNLIDYFINNLDDVLPLDRRIFIHLDLGITGDAAGIAAGFYQGDYIDDDRALSIKKPRIKVPFAIRLYRKKGQETSINKIIEFFIWMSTKWEIFVTMDTYQSRSVYQSLITNKVKSKFISVDRNADPYNFLKMLMYEDLIEGPNNGHLKKELGKLRLVKGKVDHPSDGSKDMADAVCGVAWGILSNMRWACKLPRKYQAILANKMLDDMYGESNNVTALNTAIRSLTNYSDEDDI